MAPGVTAAVPLTKLASLEPGQTTTRDYVSLPANMGIVRRAHAPVLSMGQPCRLHPLLVFGVFHLPGKMTLTWAFAVSLVTMDTVHQRLVERHDT